LILSFFILGLETNQAQSSLNCGAIVDGFRFCSTSSVVSTKSGEHIILNLSLQNMTDKSLNIQKGGTFNELFGVKLIDLKGTRVLSIFETLKKKQESHTLSESEAGILLQFCCINKMPAKRTIAPKEEVKWELNLDDFYDLSGKGEYTLYLSRRIAILYGGEAYVYRNKILTFNVAKTIEIPLKAIKIRLE